MSRLLVITGPSGVGKGTLISQLRLRRPELALSISATTRSPRPGERDGEAYHFLSEQEFDRRLAAGEFVEHASYAGHRYGTLRSELERRSRGGAPVVLEIEVQGARQIRDAMPHATLVFIAPPSLQALQARLEQRGTDRPSDIAERVRLARQELEARDEFAHTIVNDTLSHAVSELEEICSRTLDTEPERHRLH
jgi:guanylate kinase